MEFHLHTNAFQKSLNLSVLLPAIEKIVRQTGFFSLGKAVTLGEGELWSQRAVLCLDINLVSHSTCEEGVCKYLLLNFDFMLVMWSEVTPPQKIHHKETVRWRKDGSKINTYCIILQLISMSWKQQISLSIFNVWWLHSWKILIQK